MKDTLVIGINEPALAVWLYDVGLVKLAEFIGGAK